MNKIDVKGFIALAVVAAYVVGALGSIGYAFHCKAWFIGICSIAVAAMALPYVLGKLRDAEIFKKTKAEE